MHGRYREQIEAKFPLEFDLLRCGLSLLPKKLQEWARVSSAFHQLANENISQRELQALRKDGIEWVPVVPVGELQLLAFMSGEVVNSEMLEWLNVLHGRHNRAMAGVRADYRHKHKFAEHQTTPIDPANQEAVFQSSVTALWFSGRPRQVLQSYFLFFLAVNICCSNIMLKIITRWQ
jgi:hypothetical protein